MFRIYKKYIALNFVYSLEFNLPTTVEPTVDDLKTIEDMFKAADLRGTNRLNSDEF